MSIGWKRWNSKPVRHQIAKPRIAIKDELLGLVAAVIVHKNRNLLLPEFRFCHRVKVHTLCRCVVAVIGSRAALLASCSGVILTICPFSSFISRAEASTAATPSFCRSTCFVVQPACTGFFFFWAATVSPPPAEKRSSRCWQRRGKKCLKIRWKVPKLHSVVLS